jgi:hypothetical protein
MKKRPSFSTARSMNMSRTRRLLVQSFIGITATTLWGTALAANTIRVGPTNAIKTIAMAAATARDGDVFEVESGDYRGDVAVWNKDNITLRAVGGRVRLLADGMAAEGKAIWVLQGARMTVEGFDFSGAQVPDRNGAGIRLEKGHLTVRNCTFTTNQNGILTADNPNAELEIVNSEFGYNGHGDGQSHNLYVGQIARLTVTGSYFHHAKVGHLLKSRAAVNDIRYNRLTDETGGTASYELEFPAGGVAYVVGNIIQQSSQTGNPHVISYGVEGYKWPKNALYLINNTLVDNRPNGGVFLRVSPGEVTVRAVNNLLVGRSKLDSAGPGDYRNNFNVDWDEFELAAREDYRLKRQSKLLGKAIDAGLVDGLSLMPDSEYRHPREVTRLKGKALHPGALQSFK